MCGPGGPHYSRPPTPATRTCRRGPRSGDRRYRPSDGHGIETARRKGMTAQKAPRGQPATSQGAVRGNGAGRVLRARRNEFASAGAHRIQRWRNPAAIKSDECEQKASHGAGVPGAWCAAAGDLNPRDASVLACSRIRTISASSCANSIVSTMRRGWKMRS